MTPARLYARTWDAIRARAITRLQQALLWELHRYARPTGLAWPSHATLAARVGCCERSVRRSLAELRDAGWLTWTGRRNRTGARRGTNLYRLAVPAALRRRERRQPDSRREEGKGEKVRSREAQLAGLGVLDRPGEARGRLAARREVVNRGLAERLVVRQPLVQGCNPGTATPAW